MFSRRQPDDPSGRMASYLFKLLVIVAANSPNVRFLQRLPAICWMACRSPCPNRPFTRSADRRVSRRELADADQPRPVLLMLPLENPSTVQHFGGASGEQVVAMDHPQNAVR